MNTNLIAQSHLDPSVSYSQMQVNRFNRINYFNYTLVKNRTHKKII
jgi:hypothetical protein